MTNLQLKRNFNFAVFTIVFSDDCTQITLLLSRIAYRECDANVSTIGTVNPWMVWDCESERQRCLLREMIVDHSPTK